jgi:hypothetical protein
MVRVCRAFLECHGHFWSHRICVNATLDWPTFTTECSLLVFFHLWPDPSLTSPYDLLSCLIFVKDNESLHKCSNYVICINIEIVINKTHRCLHTDLSWLTKAKKTTKNKVGMYFNYFLFSAFRRGLKTKWETESTKQASWCCKAGKYCGFRLQMRYKHFN